jgi:sugar phosphate isomerase/epimerase
MHLGIFTKTFPRSTLEENLDAVVASGLLSVQYNLVCAGLPSLPDAVDPAVAKHIQAAVFERGITMTAVSGTFNIIDQDKEELARNMTRLDVLAGSCRSIGTSVITLCTGTRDPENMWRHHPENTTSEAWLGMCRSMEKVAEIAERHSVDVGIEPEMNNVVSDARKARQVMDEIGSPRIKVILDGANLITAENNHRMEDVFKEAMDLLGADIVMSHAKDVIVEGSEVRHVAPGTGQLDYEAYIDVLSRAPIQAPLILHGLDEEQVPDAVAMIRKQMKEGSG